MSNSSGTKQTRAIFGCSGHPEYVGKDAFRLIKMVTSLLPGVAVTILEPAILYTVPISQVARPVLENATYTVLSEMDGSYIEPRVVQQGFMTRHHYNLLECPTEREVSGLTIFHEKAEHGFSLVPDATYSEAKMITARTSVDHIGWGKRWTFHFREVYPYPSTSDSEKFLFFNTDPVYEIEVVTDGWVDDEIVLSVIESNLPQCYLPKRNQPPFVLANPNN